MTKKESVLGVKSIAENKQISKAVNAIYQYVEKTNKEKQLLTEDGQNILVQITLHKLPQKQKETSIKIPLPQPLLGDTPDICLFVKDLDKKNKDSEPSKHHFQDLLSSNKVKHNIEVIPLKALKLEYIPFEAKRNLSNQYDVFLADERIARLLPRYLGKNFYGRKKLPIPVNLKAKKLSKEIDRVLSYAVCSITGKGTSFSATVSKTNLSEADTVSNITASLDKISECVPGGQDNIKAVYLKSAVSPALPVFISEVSPNTITFPKVKTNNTEDDFEDVTTVEGAKVRVLKSGVVQLKYDNAQIRQQFKDEDEELKQGKRKRKQKDTPKKSDTTPEKKLKLEPEESEEVENDENIAEENSEDESASADTTPVTKKGKKQKLATPKTKAETPKTKAETPKTKAKLQKKNTPSVKPVKEEVKTPNKKNKGKKSDTPVSVKKEGQMKISDKKTTEKSPNMEAKGKKKSVKTPKSKKLSK